MSDNELAIVVLSIVFGSIFGIVVVSKLIGLAKTWINRNKTPYDDEMFDRLAKAFIKHKKDMERRMQNIEAIITDEGPAEVSSSSGQQDKPRASRSIEIEEEQSESEKEDRGVKSDKLPNMLNRQKS